MPQIVISEFMDEDAVRNGLAGFDVLFDPALVDRPDDLATALADAEALIVRNRTRVGAGLLDTAPRLRTVGRLGVGLDNIDVEACKVRNIAVFPATGANDVSVAEYVIAGAMILLRGAYGATGEVIAGSWPRNRLMGRELHGRRLGLIGFGSIAKEVVKRASAFDMQMIAHDPFIPVESAVWNTRWGPVEPVSLERLLETADVISLHVPLTESTRNLIDAAALSRMRPDAILVNAARGGVVDERALADALKNGRLGGAALDVFDAEPLSATNGGVFSDCPNLLLTPHIAGVTQESNVRVSRMIAEKVRAHLRNEEI